MNAETCSTLKDGLTSEMKGPNNWCSAIEMVEELSNARLCRVEPYRRGLVSALHFLACA